ncbi:MAG: MBL fold metallo-hydrolase [Chloroflexi bacterium]|nr:MBL fold metallo-hydrolase [Chloroflexota bacterium]
MSQSLDLLFLGSGNAFASGRYWSSFLLNGRYLFDASPVALPHLKRTGTALEEIEAIFISHFHGDHFLGLPFLLLEYAEHTARTKELTILGPPGIEERVRVVMDACYPHVFQKEAGYKVTYIDVEDGLTGQVAGAKFIARSVTHVDELDCFGYRLETGGRIAAYSGDSMMCDALVDLASGADVFVVECSCWQETCGPHLGPDDLRELRRQLGPEPAFILTHLDAGQENLGIENTLVADDLARFHM